MRRYRFYILLILIGTVVYSGAYSQAEKKKMPGSTSREKKDEKVNIQYPPADTGKTTGGTQDTFMGAEVKTSTDTLSPETKLVSPRARSGIDSIVTYSAKDSVIFTFKTKKMRLRGDAKLVNKQQKLEAEVIELDLNNSSLSASGVRDSSGRLVGFPKFNDKGEEFVGEQIGYNFKTKQGTINLGETQMEEGFYFGSKIKRVADNVLFVKDGKYTTCKEPYYYFGSPKMKVIANDRVFLDPIILYVEDMPVFILPFGLFFPSKGGRQSGIIVPSFYFSRTRGVVLENMGYYFALSDYYDTKFLADFYSKGGYLLKNETRWALRDVFSGNMNLQWGETRNDPDAAFDKNFSFDLSHRHTISPTDNLNINLKYATANFYQNTAFNPAQTSTQEMSSNAGYNKSFQDGMSISMRYNRSQNIIDNTYNQGSTVAFSIPQLYPLKGLISPQSSLPGWLRDISFRSNVSGNWNESGNNRAYNVYDAANDTTIQKERLVVAGKRKIVFSPSLSIVPKLGFFTIQPNINYSMNSYFRKVTKQWNPADSSVTESVKNGFFYEYTYNYGVSATTKLFGILRPHIFGINAFRHTFQPSVSYSYTPDMSDYGQFYGYYFNPVDSVNVRYSRFELDGGGIASTRVSQMLTYRLNNKFEAKVAVNDTAEKNIELLTWNVNGSYDMSKDSLRFSDLRMSFNTPNIGDLRFSANAGFTLYDEARQWDPRNNTFRDNFTRINQLLLANGKGLMRLTNLDLTMSTSISSQGMSFGTSFGDNVEEEKKPAKDSMGLGEHFSRRINEQKKQRDFFGDNNPGYSPVNFPWRLNVDLRFNYSEPIVKQITRRLTLNATLDFSITDTWKLNAGMQYDFIGSKLINPTISLTKDLECWELLVNWYPTGYNKGFYLRFGIKAQQLKDLQYEKRQNRFY